ncbi:hypothetical protein SH668x_000369 [Planctomicrobium sp. SH668]|uniref:hypothetical protein n=1 Tax=Planctomicrobium sp. SH668 TaxID=3448126 RepID=UPI003F5C5957
MKVRLLSDELANEKARIPHGTQKEFDNTLRNNAVDCSRKVRKRPGELSLIVAETSRAASTSKIRYAKKSTGKWREGLKEPLEQSPQMTLSQTIS